MSLSSRKLNELNQKLDGVRADMLTLVRKGGNMTIEKQNQVMQFLMLVVVTASFCHVCRATGRSSGWNRVRPALAWRERRILM